MNTIDYYVMLAGFPESTGEIPIEKIEHLINLHDQELLTPIAITDHSNMSIIACSKNIINLTGFSSDEFMEKGMDLAMEIMHPDDFDRLPDIHYQLFQTYFSIKAELRNQLKYCYSVRFKRKNGEYIWVMHEVFFILTDKMENPRLSALTLRDIRTIKNDDNLILHIYNPFDNNDVQLVKKYPLQKEKPLLTLREQEILKMISKGELTKQIAGNLKISEYTVSKHRQNMLHKTKCSTIGELVNKATSLGWMKLQ